jgi:hypothetical protein
MLCFFALKKVLNDKKISLTNLNIEFSIQNCIFLDMQTQTINIYLPKKRWLKIFSYGEKMSKKRKSKEKQIENFIDDYRKNF